MNLFHPKRIGIVCKGRDEDVSVLDELIESVEERVDVILDEATAHKLQKHGIKIEEMDVDLLICIGGDGTILRTLHALKSPTPVLGINTGAIGFLAEVQPENSVSTLTRLLEGFEVERKERLSATPTGSTAYAMSAGGPIVDPKVNATIIVPIAPFKLSARPTVVDINSEISLALLEMKDAELVIDGQFYRAIGKEERISITRGEPALFVKIWGKHFLKLRDKLRSEEEK
jgi:NAD+ kinase